MKKNIIDSYVIDTLWGIILILFLLAVINYLTCGAGPLEGCQCAEYKEVLFSNGTYAGEGHCQTWLKDSSMRGNEK